MKCKTLRYAELLAATSVQAETLNTRIGELSFDHGVLTKETPTRSTTRWTSNALSKLTFERCRSSAWRKANKPASKTRRATATLSFIKATEIRAWPTTSVTTP